MPKATSVTKAAAMNLMGHSELVRLRRENEQLRMERGTIKKAAGIEAKETG
jgi:transposase